MTSGRGFGNRTPSRWSVQRSRFLGFPSGFPHSLVGHVPYQLETLHGPAKSPGVSLDLAWLVPTRKPVSGDPRLGFLQNHRVNKASPRLGMVHPCKEHLPNSTRYSCLMKHPRYVSNPGKLDGSCGCPQKSQGFFEKVKGPPTKEITHPSTKSLKRASANSAGVRNLKPELT